jgi:Ca-activated chloride channel family protein
VATHPDARAALTWAMRSTPAALPADGGQLLSRLTYDPNTAVPVSEQAVWTHNTTADALDAVATYLPSPGTQLDYPYVVTVPESDATPFVSDLLGRLHSSAGRQLFLDHGFRDTTGNAGTKMTRDAGVDPSYDANVTNRVPSSTTVDDIIRSVAISNEPSRLLAVLDVSGSMSSEVPGAGGVTRLELARAATARGLSLYPPDSQVGLWVFSRNLTADADYRELVPVGPLDVTQNGLSGQQRIAQALASVQVNPDGGTGLYDTTLAAVRAMRASWDPARVNAVLILSDGENDDAGSISLSDLVKTLSTEQDDAHPVPVITIAFGPDSDPDAMLQISKATGGASYMAHDPRDIGEIFLDAVGQRLCRPNC